MLKVRTALHETILRRLTSRMKTSTQLEGELSTLESKTGKLGWTLWPAFPSRVRLFFYRAPLKLLHISKETWKTAYSRTLTFRRGLDLTLSVRPSKQFACIHGGSPVPRVHSMVAAQGNYPYLQLLQKHVERVWYGHRWRCKCTIAWPMIVPSLRLDDVQMVRLRRLDKETKLPMRQRTHRAHANLRRATPQGDAICFPSILKIDLTRVSTSRGST